jgi:DNA-binding NtrC family response regulator
MGAYTGAEHARGGLAKEAENGTLFLDEVESLPLDFQAKILRLVEEREYRLIGSSKSVKADIRIVSATNGSLHDLIRAGRFRQDLYYRIAGMNLDLPPLRTRKDDIPGLARYFVRKCAQETGQEEKLLPQPTLAALESYDWPGNVRELAHVVTRAFEYCEGKVLNVESLDLACPGVPEAVPSFRKAKASLVATFERDYLMKTLAATNWNISEAARRAEMARSAFWRKMNELGITKPRPNGNHLETPT